MERMDIDPEAVRAAHRKFVTGVTIVTTEDDGVPLGLAVNAFTSVSLSPPLILVCVSHTSSTYGALFRADSFAVNILAADQAATATRFASKSTDKFSGIPWRRGVLGAPILDGVSAYFEVETREKVRASTHSMFIGKVVDAAGFDRQPLVYLSGAFYDPDGLRPATT
jgi:flavin reductase (DIM6/NTAB) family NADH-FMN oxidoreductase RutF